MSFVDWTSPRPGQVVYTAARFATAKTWFFERWSVERGLDASADLSGACKYGSIFMQSVFGGSIRGHYEHQYNFIDGRIVDLSHDALDVGRMRHPYLHEPDYFEVPRLQASLNACRPRAEQWATEFVAHCRADGP